ncbi:MAG: ABC transporter permease [Proteobacteria bacterium]|nr:ABC transporter permease [Pseudomonadota bacterium]MBU4469074.1 ABC transporter permease [Pseudomonadota bacterium]
MMVTRIRSIARKEFYHLVRDFRSLYLAFAIPLLLILLFGYALSLDVDNVKTVVLDYDRSPVSRDFIRQMDASAYFHVLGHIENEQQVAEYLDHGFATMVVVFPENWTEQLMANHDSPLQVVIDGSDPNYAGISAAYISGFVGRYNSRLLRDFLNAKGMEKINPPVEGRVRVWFNEDLESRNFIVPGIIAIIIMIVGAMLTSLVIAREYENGTMETLLSLPIRAVEFLIGKSIPYFFIGMTDVMMAVVMGQVLFGVMVKSSFLLLVLAAVLYLCVALSLGLLISIITKSQLVANQVAILITYLPSLMLSDFVFPIVNMPKVLQKVTVIVPAKYFIDILNGLYLRNVGLDFLWPDYAVLLSMFCFLAVLTLLKMKQEGM